MKFDNLIYLPIDLKGETIQGVYSYRGELVLTTESSRFAILAPKNDEGEEDALDECYIRVLGPSEVFRKLQETPPLVKVLKQSNVLDFVEFEKATKAKYEEQQARSRELAIEREKKLLAELKAKYE